MLPVAEKAKAAPISRSDLENSFYTWQMSCGEYVHERCKCQVNAAPAGLSGCRINPAQVESVSAHVRPSVGKCRKCLASVAAQRVLTITYDLQAVLWIAYTGKAIHKKTFVE